MSNARAALSKWGRRDGWRALLHGIRAIGYCAKPYASQGSTVRYSNNRRPLGDGRMR